MEAASGRIGLILELKAAGLVYDVCAIVRAGGFEGPIIYASFLHEELRHVRRTDPDSKTLVLFKRLPKDPCAEAVTLQATHVGLRVDVVTRLLVHRLHYAHLTVLVYTVNKPADITRMKTFGVDCIISNFPDRL